MSRRSDQLDFPVNLAGAGSLHRAVYDALRDAMLHGRLASGTRLPSTRDLARQLSVARGTVVAVFEQLRSEGYLEARRGSGTVVASELPDRWFDAGPRGSRASAAAAPLPPLRLSAWGRSGVTTPFAIGAPKKPRPLRPHVPAIDMFPVETWTRLVARRARRDDALWLDTADVRGYAPLREVLAEHLRVARGVVCRAEQLVVVPSVQQALDLVGRLVLDRGDALWMEDPGYVGAQAVFRGLGAELVPVPVDDEGLDVAAGIARAPDAKLAYVTPGHQAPLGVTMTLARRLELLAWASAHRSVVFEDDYDSEYRYEGRPVPSLQGLDRAGVVVHAGTFSKTLLPSLRLAYVVLPDALIDPFLSAKTVVDRFTPALVQAVLADFLEGGHFGRHLRRMREIYAERRSALLGAVESELGGLVTRVGASAGLDFTLRLPRGSDDRALASALGGAGVEAYALSPHAASPRAHQGLVLGFAPFSPARIRKSVGVIREVLSAHRPRA